MGDAHENAELDNIDDHEDTRTDLMEDWDKKFEEWRTPKKRLFLAKLMQSINRYVINVLKLSFFTTREGRYVQNG